jgi:hypothetical protein
MSRRRRLAKIEQTLAAMEKRKRLADCVCRLVTAAGDVRDALAKTMSQVHARKMDPRTANALAYLATSLLRAIELSDLEGRLMAIEGRMEQSNGNP